MAGLEVDFRKFDIDILSYASTGERKDVLKLIEEAKKAGPARSSSSVSMEFEGFQGSKGLLSRLVARELRHKWEHTVLAVKPPKWKPAKTYPENLFRKPREYTAKIKKTLKLAEGRRYFAQLPERIQVHIDEAKKALRLTQTRDRFAKLYRDIPKALRDVRTSVRDFIKKARDTRAANNVFPAQNTQQITPKRFGARGPY